MTDKSFFDSISVTDYNTLENIRDNHESLFTIMIYNTSKEIFVKDLNDRLKKIQEIKNSFKKKKLNDRLYKFIQKIELDNKDKNQAINEPLNENVILSDYLRVLIFYKAMYV